MESRPRHNLGKALEGQVAYADGPRVNQVLRRHKSPLETDPNGPADGGFLHAA